MHPLITKAFQSAGFDLSDLKVEGNITTHIPTSQRFLTRIATDHALPQMKGEAQGLIAMNLTSTKLAPRLIAIEISEDGNEGAMISDYWDLGGGKSSSEIQRELARKIAKMHTPPNINEDDPVRSTTSNTNNTSQREREKSGYRYTEKYGFGIPTHCGISELDNTWEETWEVFFRDRRLEDVVNKIGDGQIDHEWTKMKERTIPLLLRNFTPAPKPVICHGDLWSGNAGVDKQSGEPVIWDPACYWGHNESDLGVMNMFGGFTKDFFDEYHKIHPKSSPHYEERQKLYELWHHLNHTLMFGGSYKGGSLRMMKDLNSWAEGQELPDAQ